ncbi:MAG: UDP-N-acetylmuramoyl-tripeptide--D-alanyl-D-alanine ligase [Neisseriaceae bacterium]|nr:UDP-N-acetylmuramoyl-tripeptide--D-alanyl-D-alanine ligase [Neisseriaceae bacterium]
MSNLTISFIADVFQSKLTLADATVRNITTDSRTVSDGDVFFALKGEKHDAHDFVDDCLEKGAICIVSRPDFANKKGCILVENTTDALGKLAKAWRCANLQIPVLAITGSSGKTTVKEMVAAVLRKKFGEDALLYTSGNLNNHIGLPLTLLKLRENHKIIVLEMGMNHFGEIDYLSNIAKPNISLINNALNAHIGNDFNGVSDIAKAKSEIFNHMENGIAIYPLNDKNANIFANSSSHLSQKTFAINSDKSDFFADNIQLFNQESIFDLHINKQTASVKLPALGVHNVLNAVAAAGLCSSFANADEIAQGLQDYQPVGSRLRMFKSKSGSQIIDDTYNANPDSMKAAIDVLAAFDKPRIFVMGDMGELGDLAEDFHRQIGEYAKTKGIETALFIGKFSKHAANSFGKNGLWFTDKTTLSNHLQQIANSQTTILFKGSRFMKMEEIVDSLG